MNRGIRPGFNPSQFDTDPTLTANSDERAPSQKAIKEYVRTKNRELLSSRLIVFGHSYDAQSPGNVAGTPIRNPFGGSWVWNAGVGTTDSGRMPDLLAGSLGVDQSNRFLTASYPSTTALVNTSVPIPIPEEGVVEAVYMLPFAAVSAQAINYREFNLGVARYGTVSWVATYTLDVNSLTQFVYQPLADLTQAVIDNSLAFRDQASGSLAQKALTVTRTVVSPQAGSLLPQQDVLQFRTAPVASGLADTGGGLVIVRWGGNYRNLAVGGSRLVKSGLYHGGWAMHFLARPPRRVYGPEVNVSSGTTAASLTVDNLEYPIPSGWKIALSDGQTVTTSADAFVNATSISLTGSVTVAAGIQGYARHPTANSYGTLTPYGLTLECHGRNDVAVPATVELIGWREAMRAVLALDCCPYFQPPERANIVYAAGNGAGASWTTGNGLIGGGQYLLPQAYTSRQARRFIGAVGGTPPTITIKLAPAYDGTPVDLFFAAQAGSTKGGAATITADSSFNGGLACTVDTRGACLNDNVTTLGGGSTFTVSGTTTLTISGGTATWTAGLTDQVGCAISATDNTGHIAPGTKIASITSSLVATLDTAGTNGTVTSPTTSGYVPMVKRLTGLSAGAHTITITLTAMDTATSTVQPEFIFLGYGLEASPVLAPVVAVGICKAPADSSRWTSVDDFNTATQQVIAGTAAPLSGNSLEPPLASSVLYVDTDTPMGKGLVTANFAADGVHTSNAGNIIRSDAVLTAIRSKYTPAQLMAV